jgi:hypothetical protein
MSDRTNHYTKYIIDGVDYRDICKRNGISETCFYSRVCSLKIPPEDACVIPTVKQTAPLKEIVRLRRTLKDIISATKAKDLCDKGCRMYCADLARIALEARYDEIPTV